MLLITKINLIINEMKDNSINDIRLNKKIKRYFQCLNNIKNYFKHTQLPATTLYSINRYIEHRKLSVSNSTINKELILIRLATGLRIKSLPTTVNKISLPVVADRLVNKV